MSAEPEWRRDKGLERYLGAARVARLLPRPVHDEPHRPGLAECVCEEPCRYCRCENQP